MGFNMDKAFVISLILILSAGIICQSKAETSSLEITISGPLTIQGNSLIANSPLPEPKVIKTIKVVATAYSSTIQQTDDTPYITAAGTFVREGIIANNNYPFGTKIRFPEIYGDKIFVVEDRMSWKKGPYHFDIWFPSYAEAKNFGAKTTYVEILES